MLILPGKKVDILCNRLRKNKHLSTSASPIDQNELEIIGMLISSKSNIVYLWLLDFCLPGGQKRSSG